MGADLYTLKNLLSRRITFAGSETQQALQSNLLARWRLVVSVGITSDVNISIQVSNQDSSYTITSSVSRGSASSFTGFGSMTCEIQNQTPAAVVVELCLDYQTTENPSYQFCSGLQIINNAAFSAVLSDRVNGFAPPFCRFLRLFCDGNLDVRFVDQGGNVVGLYLGLTPQDILLNQLHVPPFARAEVQSVAANQNLMSLWF